MIKALTFFLYLIRSLKHWQRIWYACETQCTGQKPSLIWTRQSQNCTKVQGQPWWCHPRGKHKICCMQKTCMSNVTAKLKVSVTQIKNNHMFWLFTKIQVSESCYVQKERKNHKTNMRGKKIHGFQFSPTSPAPSRKGRSDLSL